MSLVVALRAPLSPSLSATSPACTARAGGEILACISILLSLLDTIRQTFVMKQIESTTRIDEESGEAIQKLKNTVGKSFRPKET